MSAVVVMLRAMIVLENDSPFLFAHPIDGSQFNGAVFRLHGVSMHILLASFQLFIVMFFPLARI